MLVELTVIILYLKDIKFIFDYQTYLMEAPKEENDDDDDDAEKWKQN